MISFIDEENRENNGTVYAIFLFVSWYLTQYELPWCIVSFTKGQHLVSLHTIHEKQTHFTESDNFAFEI